MESAGLKFLHSQANNVTSAVMAFCNETISDKYGTTRVALQ